MIRELRIYAIAAGRMDDWQTLFTAHIVPFHEREGFPVRAAWRDDANNQFVWIRDAGSAEQMSDFSKKFVKQDFAARAKPLFLKVLESRMLREAITPRF